MGSDLPAPRHRCSTNCCICQSPSALEAISNLLTVSMHLQDSLSRFLRPGLHKVDLRVHVGECVDSHPCVSRIPELLNWHSTIVPGEQLHILLHWSLIAFPRKLHQPVPSARIHQNLDKPCSWRTHTRDTTCFQQNL